MCAKKVAQIIELPVMLKDDTKTNISNKNRIDEGKN